MPSSERSTTSRPIADYAMLSGCRCAALVSGDGSVDWLCLPRFDAPSLFARLLDDGAGHWFIHPAGDYEMSRRYLPESLALQTTMVTPKGSATLTDALVFDADERGHAIGLNAPHVLVRVVEATAGSVTIDAEFAPRPEYGIVHPRLRLIAGGVLARGGSTVLVMAGPPPTVIDGSTARWRLELKVGDTIAFALQFSTSSDPRPQPWPPQEVKRRLKATCEGWRSWSGLHQVLPGSVDRPRPPQRPGAAGTDLPAHRCGHRRGDDIAPGARRRGA